MPDQFVEAFVDKLILLEKSLGARTHYRVMSPLTAPFHDLSAIQTIAKQIAEFIGLGSFTFIISAAKQKENVGGHIDLSIHGKEVFVEVDPNMMKFPDSVAATICHEACHKWLQVNGIRSPAGIDDEILTDITSVFLGFGKTMLNGCSTTFVKHEPINNGTRKITETMTVGYLDLDQLAFVYRLVCEMRSIPSSDFMEGLNAEAALAVERCDSLHGHYYAPRFHSIETTQKNVTNFNSRVIEVQSTMAGLDKHLTYIRKSLCDTIDNFLIGGHKRIETLQLSTVAMTQDSEPDPALRFLRAIQSDSKVKELIDEIRTVSKEAEELLKHTRTVGHHLSRSNQRFPAPSPEMFSIVSCPKDGTKLRLPENSDDIIATCPMCKYRFLYNTRPISFRRLIWWQKIRNLIRQKKKV
jgi:hypothetical protein